jgi:hypothetical protein
MQSYYTLFYTFLQPQTLKILGYEQSEDESKKKEDKKQKEDKYQKQNEEYKEIDWDKFFSKFR